jgi:hypothetical protein
MALYKLILWGLDGEFISIRHDVPFLNIESGSLLLVFLELPIRLERKDSTGVNRVMMSTLAGADGSFVFCPISTGAYDVSKALTGTAVTVA